MQAKQGLSAPARTSASTISETTVDGRKLPTRAKNASLYKRHFKAVAAILADYWSDNPNVDVVRQSIARDLARYFAANNERFDRARFLAAADAE